MKKSTVCLIFACILCCLIYYESGYAAPNPRPDKLSFELTESELKYGEAEDYRALYNEVIEKYMS